jgi:hypothetical protein
MELEFLNSIKDHPSHVVRVLLPFGVYPANTIITEDSFLYVSKEICFSVVPYCDDKVENEYYYSEVEWATFNEIRLYGSILLCIDRDESYLRIYPFRYAHYIKLSSFSEVINNINKIQSLLVKTINSPGRWIPEHNFRATNIYKNSKESFLPPICGGHEYDFRETGVRYELQKILFSNFDISNHLLLRGVATLLKSAMLSTHILFMEEAINTLFISLEASFRLILKKLDDIGIKNPSSEDAAQYISKIFYSESANKYFDEYYKSRIMSFHPESRFGIFPHAPLMVDDQFHLFTDLIDIYAFLVCGYVNPKYKEKYDQYGL